MMKKRQRANKNIKDLILQMIVIAIRETIKNQENKGNIKNFTEFRVEWNAQENWPINLQTRYVINLIRRRSIW